MSKRLTDTAETVLERRYYLKDSEGNIIEDWDKLCARVAKHVAMGDIDLEDDFYKVMYNLEFLPNSPTLFNAGTELGQLAACFAIPVGDSMEEIFQFYKEAALIFKSGGGVGTNWSYLRPAGSPVLSTQGVASGALSFMNIFNETVEVVKSGGKRRGAAMSMLNVDHPEIEAFITAKKNKDKLKNMNLSVGITDEFMQRIVDGDVEANRIFDLIATSAHESAEPGLLFLSMMEKCNPTPHIGKLDKVNPCAEINLLSYEACNLGSINLAKFVDTEIDWQDLERVVRIAVRFLDNVVTVNKYPIEKIKTMTQANRKLGLGIAGLHDLLIKLGLPYDSEEGRELAAEVMKFIEAVAVDESYQLARVFGDYPNYSTKYHPSRRNATLTCIAPTGSLSMFMNVASGAEPYFGIVTVKTVMDNDKLLLVNELFKEVAEREGFYSEELMYKVAESGTVLGHKEIPDKWQQVFKTAMDISPEDHVRMQAALQNNGVHNAISKCLAAGTLIPTNKGLIKVEDFTDNITPDSFVELQEEIYTGGNRITSHYYGGEKLCTRVRFNNGSDLIGATESHKVLTPSGWVRLVDLKVGDIVIGKLESHHTSGSLPINPLGEFKSNSNKLVVPGGMSPNLAEFLGMMCADGVLVESAGTVGLVKNDTEVMKRFYLLCEDLFGVTPLTKIDSRNGVKTHYLTSRVLVRWVRGLIGVGAYNKHTPTQILQGSREEKLGFIKGCCLDGYIVEGGLTIYMGMSKQLAYELAEMCRSFGLPLVRQVSKRISYNGNTNHGVSYGVTISNELLDLITPVEQHKDTTKYVKYMVYTDTDWDNLPKVPTKDPFYLSTNYLRKKKPNYINYKLADKFGIDKTYHAFKVTHVEDAGILPVFDIEVENSHSYVVNGVVSHNTINMPATTTVDDVKKAYILAWKLGCKGITIYRDGSLSGQVLTTGKQTETATVSTTGPVKAELPDTLRARRYKVKLDNEESIYILICFDNDGKPMEVFAKFPFENMLEYREKSVMYTTVCRLISLALRYGIPVDEIIKQLDKASGSMFDLPAQITKLLKMFLSETNQSYKVQCPDCKEGMLVFKEGCQICESCGYSKCS